MISNELLLAYSFYVRSRELTNRGLLDMAHLPLSPTYQSKRNVHRTLSIVDIALRHCALRNEIAAAVSESTRRRESFSIIYQVLQLSDCHRAGHVDCDCPSSQRLNKNLKGQLDYRPLRGGGVEGCPPPNNTKDKLIKSNDVKRK